MSYAVSHFHHPHKSRRKPYIHPSLVGGHVSNIRETEDAYLIDLVAPGRSRELFGISVKDDVLKLIIQAPEAEAEGTFIQREFTLSESEKHFRLPNSVDTEGISASYTEGILSIRLPKKAEAQPRQINIE